MADLAGIIGRKQELETLERLYLSPKSEFLIVYGRRRIGKTFLINRKFEGRFTFYLTALSNATTEAQLMNFHTALSATWPELAAEGVPTNWFNAFQLLIKLAEADKRVRKIIFFDELPWFDAYASDFLQALEHFWNSWASRRTDVLLIGCGSAASWMINQLIHNKGGLHNRITERIALQPFNLADTEAFLQAKGAVYDRFQLLELYMAMGGVPFYLEHVIVNRSVAQNIDRLFFSPGALLNMEYGDLYRSLFHRPERHIAIVEALAHKSGGMERKELLQAAKISDGGTAGNTLDELEQSGFIRRYFPFGKVRRDAIYQLVDPYSLFYLVFVKDSKAEGDGAWLQLSKSPRWKAWSGYAFEYICRSHIESIKKQLSINGIYSEVSPWRSKAKTGGAQIDLLIDRSDRVINVCEMKFFNQPFSIDHAYAESLRNKLMVFREETGSNKTLFLTMITTFGLKNNAHSMQLVHDSLDMNALFL